MTTPQPPTPGLLIVAAPLAGADDVRALCERLRTLVASCDARTIVCDVSAVPATARALEALARLQLTAHRLQRRIRLQRASRELEQLLDFAGLADVVSSQ